IISLMLFCQSPVMGLRVLHGAFGNPVGDEKPNGVWYPRLGWRPKLDKTVGIVWRVISLIVFWICDGLVPKPNDRLLPGPYPPCDPRNGVLRKNGVLACWNGLVVPKLPVNQLGPAMVLG